MKIEKKDKGDMKNHGTEDRVLQLWRKKVYLGQGERERKTTSWEKKTRGGGP